MYTTLFKVALVALRFPYASSLTRIRDQKKKYHKAKRPKVFERNHKAVKRAEMGTESSGAIKGTYKTKAEQKSSKNQQRELERGKEREHKKILVR